MRIFRQGDVLILEAQRAEGLTPIAREAGRVVLAHGEVTGHSHAIVSQSARFALNEQTLQRFLDVRRPVVLRHEEHADVRLPCGFYEIRIQREYEPTTMSRAVAD